MRFIYILIAKILKWEKVNEYKVQCFGCQNEYLETFRMKYKGKRYCLAKREYSYDGQLWFITSLKNWNE
jgi:hypothetical protein